MAMLSPDTTASLLGNGSTSMKSSVDFRPAVFPAWEREQNWGFRSYAPSGAGAEPLGARK